MFFSMMAGRSLLLLLLAITSLDIGAAEATGRAYRNLSAILVAAEGDSQPETAPTDEGPSGATYMQPLSRLASILGSVHFLRKMCGDEKAGVWRDKMNELLTTLSPKAADRKILIAAFNDGYRAFESTYRTCTPSARLALARFQSEGGSLSREISARYGN